MRDYDFYKNRAYPIIILICICFVLIILKLFSIQIINNSYKISAQNNVVRKIIKNAERGWVYDRNHQLLISNQKYQDIMIVPYQLDKQMDTVLFCEIFNISLDDFNKKVRIAKKYSNYKPSIFIRDIEKKSFINIQENLHLFKGFYAQEKYLREYSTSSGGNIFGYIGQITNKLLLEYPNYRKDDLIGISGVEKIYEEFLKGEKGVERKVVDVFGRYQGQFKEGQYDTLPQAGQDITLTIDIKLQEYAEKMMMNKRGSIVAIEPESGEILCLVSSPTFDPAVFLGKKRSENFRKLYLDPGKPLYNRSISANYPPG